MATSHVNEINQTSIEHISTAPAAMVTIWFPYVGVACSSGGHSPPGRDNTKGAGKTGLQVGFRGNFENTVFQALNKSAWLLDKPIWAVF